MRKHRDRVDWQVEVAPVEQEILEHAQPKIRARLRFMLKVDRESGIFAAEFCLDQEIPGAALSFHGEPLLVDEFDMIEVYKGMDIGQEGLEKVTQQAAGLQERF